MTIHVFTPIMPHEGRVALKSIRKFNSITGKLEDNRVGLRDDGSKEGHSCEEKEDAKHLPNGSLRTQKIHFKGKYRRRNVQHVRFDLGLPQAIPRRKHHQRRYLYKVLV